MPIRKTAYTAFDAEMFSNALEPSHNRVAVLFCFLRAFFIFGKKFFNFRY